MINNKKNILIPIIIIITIIIIVITIVLLVNLHYNSEQSIIERESAETNEELPPLNNKVTKVASRSNYMTNREIVNKFYNNYKSKSKSICKMFSKEYMEYSNITEDNVYNIIPKIDNTVEVNITEMYEAQINYNVKQIIVYGYLKGEITNKIENFKIMINVDYKENTFEVFLEDYLDKNYPDLNMESQINIDEQKNIESNQENIFEYSVTNDEEYCVLMFNSFINNMLYYPKYVYDKIDEEYRKERFTDYNDYLNFIEESKVDFYFLELEQYQKVNENNKNKYILIDSRGNYYIFTENAAMDYNVIMDMYTIELDDVIQKYNEMDVPNKSIYNIEQIVSAINNKDYEYIYSKLDETFKSTNFPTFESLKKYILEQFYYTNKIDSKKYEYVGNVGIVGITISDLDGNKEEILNKKFFIQLGEGTNFTLSFEK